MQSPSSICTKINKEWIQVQASRTDGVRYSQVLICSKACCDYVLYAPWNDVMHAHFVSKVHLYMYKMHMHHYLGVVTSVGTKCPTCWSRYSALASAELVLTQQKIKHGPAGHSLQYPINIAVDHLGTRLVRKRFSLAPRSRFHSHSPRG